MNARLRTIGGGAGYGSGLWPVLLSLLVVLIPTACVLWFLNAAVQNERLAAKQKLAEAYRGYLPILRERIESYWKQQGEALDAAAKSPGPAAFAACVRGHLADSVVCYDSSGRVSYPSSAGPQAGKGPGVRAADQLDDGVWAEARRLEFGANNPMAAAAAYREIASKTSDNRSAALALQAQARCLVRAGRKEDAIAVLAGTLAAEKYCRVLDSDGRLIAADAQLRALELAGDHDPARFAQIVERLAKCLDDYSTPLPPAAQRRFLMKELCRLTSGAPTFPTLEAEELAAAYLDTNPPRAADGALRPSGLADLWRMASPGGRVVALLRTRSVLERTAELVSADVLPGGVRVTVAPPDAETAENAAHLLPAGATMPRWRLTLALADGDRTDPVTSRRVAVYVWIAILVIATMSIIAAAVGLVLRRQMRLTRLKNDLLATVSHELKTPLSSMRLLVDTLLDAPEFDVAKTREYLGLVAKENARLSHLIDNFLSYSRMERGKRAFEFAEVSAAEIVRQAVEAAGERFQSAECRLEVETDPSVPPIQADADALVTVLLNLLDNAYKYSGDSKRIALRTYADAGNACFAVGDNGIGLSPRAAKKVFRPFFQVDRQLSRSAGGCGLGLSIVKFIVAAHGGTIRVESSPGKGSTFTIVVPGSWKPNT